MALAPTRRHFAILESKAAVKLPELIALGDYTAPTMPTEHAFRQAWNRVTRRLTGQA